ncbi:MAG: hypothetical protein ACTSU5_01280 [Promethearchaeota archaeon]
MKNTAIEALRKLAGERPPVLVPQPVEVFGYKPVRVPDSAFTRKAFQLFNSRLFIDYLRRQTEAVNYSLPRHATRGVTPPPAGSPPGIEEAFRQLLGELDVVHSHHYSILQLMVYASIVLHRLGKEYPSPGLFSAELTVQFAAVQYNAHNPSLSIKVEERALVEASAVVDLIDDVIREVRELGAEQWREPSRDFKFRRRVSLFRDRHVHAVTATGGRGEEVGVSPKSAARGSNDVYIDFSRTIPEVLSQIKSNLEVLLGVALKQVERVREKGANIGYNVYTREWGSVPAPWDAPAPWELAARGAAGNFSPEKVDRVRPKFFLAPRMVEMKIPLRVVRGESLHWLSLAPGETRSVRSVTSSTTREARNREKSIHDGVNTSNIDSWTRAKDETLRATDSSAIDESRYIDADTRSTVTDSRNVRNHVESGVKTESGLGVLKKILPSATVKLNASVLRDVDLGSEQIREEGVAYGASTDINRTIEKSSEVASRVARNHQAVVNASKDVAVTEATEETSETQRSETQEVSYKNPNEDAGINIDFSSRIREYVIVTSLVGMELVLSNTIFSAKAEGPEVDAFVDEYVSDPVIRSRLREYYQGAFRVFDFAGREFDVHDSSAGYHKFRPWTYRDFLEHWLESHPDHEFSQVEVDIAPFLERIRGVVVRVEYLADLVPGVEMGVNVTEPLLSSNKQELVQNEIRAGAASAAALEVKVDLMKERVAFTKDMRLRARDPSTPVEDAEKLFLASAGVAGNGTPGLGVDTSRLVDLALLQRLWGGNSVLINDLGE